MSNLNNRSTPDPGDKFANKQTDQGDKEIASENIQNRFLQDILSEKHIPQLRQGQKGRSEPTLLEAIFDATIIRAFSLAVNELKLLGSTIVNKSVLLGMSKAFGQSHLTALLKGEIKDIPAGLDKATLHKVLARLEEKKAKKTESSQKSKEKGLDKKAKEKIQKDEANKEKDSEGSKESEAKTIPSQEPDTESINKRYNIDEIISQATELELSMLGPTEQETHMVEKLEQNIYSGFDAGRTILKKPALSIDRLKLCIEQFSAGKILVVGDLLIDELLEGRAERISREAPVLILEHVDTVLIPGGAANTAHNVTALGGKCHAIGICGKDDYAEKLKELLTKHNIDHSLVADADRPTTVKTRILSKTHALMQQLLRLDRISHEPISKGVEQQLISNLENISTQYPILILSDYRGGVITDGLIQACRKISAAKELTIIVDAQDQFERFQNVSLLTPNQPDTEQALGYKINNEKDLLQAGQDMLLLTGAKSVLITRGKEGMFLFSCDSEPISLPAFNRSEVYDVSGAGDTVVATVALALSTGSSLAEAMALGSIAASIVVKKPGTAVTNQTEMLELLPLIKLP